MLSWPGTRSNIQSDNEILRHFVGDSTGRGDDMFDGVVVDTGKVETLLADAASGSLCPAPGHC